MFKKALSWYKGVSPSIVRVQQLESIVNAIEDFPFDRVCCIETGASQNWDDGCVGAYFAKLCQFTNGEFHSVDIYDYIVEGSKALYKDLGIEVNHYTQDSVTFLEETDIIPNLVHLDSWDLDLKNPFPSALHGWREFVAIEDKMPVGSILIVDDNFFAAEPPTRTWVTWNYTDGRESERIDINYPIVGKGSNIWHFIESGKSNWKKLSQDTPGPNVKLVYQKIKK
jgi:hypothetical protein